MRPHDATDWIVVGMLFTVFALMAAVIALTCLYDITIHVAVTGQARTWYDAAFHVLVAMVVGVLMFAVLRFAWPKAKKAEDSR